MNEDSAQLSAAIGSRVRQHRLGREWTLDDLAEAAGVSRRAVVNVEQGAANPSVATLLRLSGALGIGLPTLVAPPEPEQASLIRAGQAPVLWTGENGGRGALVAGTTPPDVVELWDWTLGPGDRHASQAHVTGTRELVHVLAGSVTLETGDQVMVLGVGDAVSFRGDLAHAYANDTSEHARFSLTVFEPSVDTNRRKEATHD